MLGSILDPLHWAPSLDREEGRQRLLRMYVLFEPEAPAHVQGEHAHPLRRPIEELRKLG